MNRQFTHSLNRLYDNSTQIGQLLQDNTYKYDNVGNIISIDDSIEILLDNFCGSVVFFLLQTHRRCCRRWQIPRP